MSLRESQIERLAESDRRRGPRLRTLMDSPNRFLAAVQVGVTLAGFISAAFGANRIAPLIAPWFEGLGVPAGVANSMAFVGATVLIVYISLVLGELVPKRLALQKAESVALVVARPIDLMARISRPFIWLLSASTNGVVRILGLDPRSNREAITGEELRGMVAAHTELSHEERELIDDVFDAGDTELREVMVPRTEVAFLDAALPVFRAAVLVSSLPHSRYPVIRESPDEVIGFVHVRDILVPGMVDRSVRLETSPGRWPSSPAASRSSRPSPRCVARASISPSSPTSTEAPRGSSRSRTSSRSSWATSTTSTTQTSPVSTPRVGPATARSRSMACSTSRTSPRRQGSHSPTAHTRQSRAGSSRPLARLPAVGDAVSSKEARFEVVALDGRRVDLLRVEPIIAELGQQAGDVGNSIDG